MSGNWEGYSGSTVEHRTVGDVRAWCHGCREWCYADSPVYGHCECCTDLALPNEYRGLSIIAAIEKARADERRAVRRAIVDNYGPESGPVNLAAVLRIIGGDDD